MANPAAQLIEAGQVRQAIESLAGHLRNHPTDTAARTTLFEALSIAGELDRAEKHLNLLAGASEQAKIGAILYFSAIHAERERHAMYKNQSFPKTTANAKVSGKLNGQPFSEIRDADHDLGARLEVFGAGSYMWVQFEHIASIRIEKPKNLRDTLWTPAFIKTGPKFQGTDMGEVLLPAIYPFSFTYPEESVWLGRQTLWVEDEGSSYPLGQKMLLVDGVEVPFLEVRTLEFDTPEGTSHSDSSATISLNS
ncbi:type VI secretion system accessory protein TagJ [Bryobacter aggregatus]|uniref:type VI secretion system accessory protein TagJ n=1 Tax=Bryobacter aggregatus TaxID=360054 RepID=UPI0004E1E7FC|nr:type VI secretion system accessory protein TagJ [Bryobacter aggregatus]